MKIRVIIFIILSIMSLVWGQNKINDLKLKNFYEIKGGELEYRYCKFNNIDFNESMLLDSIWVLCNTYINLISPRETNNRVIGFNLNNKNLEWDIYLDSYPVKVKKYDEFILILTQKYLYQINALGEINWQFNLDGGLIKKAPILDYIPQKFASINQERSGSFMPDFDIKKNKVIIEAKRDSAIIFDIQDKTFEIFSTELSDFSKSIQNQYEQGNIHFWEEKFLIIKNNFLICINADFSKELFRFKLDKGHGSVQKYPILLADIDNNGITECIFHNKGYKYFIINKNGDILADKEVKYKSNKKVPVWFGVNNSRVYSLAKDELSCFDENLDTLWIHKSDETFSSKFLFFPFTMHVPFAGYPMFMEIANSDNVIVTIADKNMYFLNSSNGKVIKKIKLVDQQFDIENKKDEFIANFLLSRYPIIQYKNSIFFVYNTISGKSIKRNEFIVHDFIGEISY